MFSIQLVLFSSGLIACFSISDNVFEDDSLLVKNEANGCWKIPHSDDITTPLDKSRTTMTTVEPSTTPEGCECFVYGPRRMKRLTFHYYQRSFNAAVQTCKARNEKLGGATYEDNRFIEHYLSTDWKDLSNDRALWHGSFDLAFDDGSLEKGETSDGCAAKSRTFSPGTKFSVKSAFGYRSVYDDDGNTDEIYANYQQPGEAHSFICQGDEGACSFASHDNAMVHPVNDYEVEVRDSTLNDCRSDCLVYTKGKQECWYFTHSSNNGVDVCELYVTTWWTFLTLKLLTEDNGKTIHSKHCYETFANMEDPETSTEDNGEIDDPTDLEKWCYERDDAYNPCPTEEPLSSSSLLPPVVSSTIVEQLDTQTTFVQVQLSEKVPVRQPVRVRADCSTSPLFRALFPCNSFRSRHMIPPNQGGRKSNIPTGKIRRLKPANLITTFRKS